MPASASALIIAVPEAEPAVGALRARYDRAASWGVPAHLTVLYPFLAPHLLDAAVLTALAGVVAAVPRFTVTLAETGWFGESVLWLSPDPAGPLRALSAAVSARFPQAPPYGGQFDDVVPHLTVAHDQPGPVLHAAEATVRASLPVTAAVTAVQLITGRPEPGGRWHTVAEFPLG